MRYYSTPWKGYHRLREEESSPPEAWYDNIRRALVWNGSSKEKSTRTTLEMRGRDNRAAVRAGTGSDPTFFSLSNNLRGKELGVSGKSRSREKRLTMDVEDPPEVRGNTGRSSAIHTRFGNETEEEHPSCDLAYTCKKQRIEEEEDSVAELMEEAEFEDNQSEESVPPKARDPSGFQSLVISTRILRSTRNGSGTGHGVGATYPEIEEDNNSSKEAVSVWSVVTSAITNGIGAIFNISCNPKRTRAQPTNLMSLSTEGTGTGSGTGRGYRPFLLDPEVDSSEETGNGEEGSSSPVSIDIRHGLVCDDMASFHPLVATMGIVGKFHVDNEDEAFPSVYVMETVPQHNWNKSEAMKFYREEEYSKSLEETIANVIATMISEEEYDMVISLSSDAWGVRKKELSEFCQRMGSIVGGAIESIEQQKDRCFHIVVYCDTRDLSESFEEGYTGNVQPFSPPSSRLDERDPKSPLDNPSQFIKQEKEEPRSSVLRCQLCDASSPLTLFMIPMRRIRNRTPQAYQICKKCRTDEFKKHRQDSADEREELREEHRRTKKAQIRKEEREETLAKAEYDTLMRRQWSSSKSYPSKNSVGFDLTGRSPDRHKRHQEEDDVAVYNSKEEEEYVEHRSQGEQKKERGKYNSTQRPRDVEVGRNSQDMCSPVLSQSTRPSINSTKVGQASRSVSSMRGARSAYASPRSKEYEEELDEPTSTYRESPRGGRGGTSFVQDVCERYPFRATEGGRVLSANQVRKGAKGDISRRETGRLYNWSESADRYSHHRSSSESDDAKEEDMDSEPDSSEDNGPQRYADRNSTAKSKNRNSTANSQLEMMALQTKSKERKDMRDQEEWINNVVVKLKDSDAYRNSTTKLQSNLSTSEKSKRPPDSKIVGQVFLSFWEMAYQSCKPMLWLDNRITWTVYVFTKLIGQIVHWVREPLLVSDAKTLKYQNWKIQPKAFIDSFLLHWGFKAETNLEFVSFSGVESALNPRGGKKRTHLARENHDTRLLIFTLGGIHPEQLDEQNYKEFTLTKAFDAALADKKNANVILTRYCINKIELLQKKHAHDIRAYILEWEPWRRNREAPKRSGFPSYVAYIAKQWRAQHLDVNEAHYVKLEGIQSVIDIQDTNVDSLGRNRKVLQDISMEIPREKDEWVDFTYMVENQVQNIFKQAMSSAYSGTFADLPSFFEHIIAVGRVMSGDRVVRYQDKNERKVPERRHNVLTTTGQSQPHNHCQSAVDDSPDEEEWHNDDQDDYDEQYERCEDEQYDCEVNTIRHSPEQEALHSRIFEITGVKGISLGQVITEEEWQEFHTKVGGDGLRPTSFAGITWNVKRNLGHTECEKRWKAHVQTAVNQLCRYINVTPMMVTDGDLDGCTLTLPQPWTHWAKGSHTSVTCIQCYTGVRATCLRKMMEKYRSVFELNEMLEVCTRSTRSQNSTRICSNEEGKCIANNFRNCKAVRYNYYSKVIPDMLAQQHGILEGYKNDPTHTEYTMDDKELKQFVLSVVQNAFTVHLSSNFDVRKSHRQNK